MLDRLVQMIVDRLEPKIERMVQLRFEELEERLKDEMDELISGSVNTFNTHLSRTIPQLKTEIQREITKKIVRGVK